MKTEIVTVTPAKAEQWLERNNMNRPLRAAVVKGLVGAIQRGEWKLSHQGIAFGKSGRLLDGQHRLHAVIESGIAVPMMVTTDAADETFSVLDIGAKRSIADTLGISPSLAACGRYLAVVEDTSRSRTLSPQYMLPYVKAVDPFLTELLDFCPSSSKAWSSAPVRSAAIIRMMDGEDREYVKLVYHTLVHGEFDTMPPVAHVLVRQYMGGGLRAQSLDMFVRCLKVFDSRNRDMRRIQITRVETEMQYAREVIAREVHGQKKPARAKALPIEKPALLPRKKSARV